MRTHPEIVKDIESVLKDKVAPSVAAHNGEINESHQRYNGKLQTRVTELEEDNKKLAYQVEDKIDLLRKTGGL